MMIWRCRPWSCLTQCGLALHKQIEDDLAYLNVKFKGKTSSCIRVTTVSLPLELNVPVEPLYAMACCFPCFSVQYCVQLLIVKHTDFTSVTGHLAVHNIP
jgi:hypothetical protein